MKLQKPITAVPPSPNGDYDKYADIWNALICLPKREWLPVKCKNELEAVRLSNTAHKHRTLDLKAAKRGNVVYLRRA